MEAKAAINIRKELRSHTGTEKYLSTLQDALREADLAFQPDVSLTLCMLVRVLCMNVHVCW